MMQDIIDKIRIYSLTDYEKSLEYCDELLNQITEEDYENQWFACYYMSYNNMKLENYKIAIQFALSAREAIKEYDINNYILTQWMVATCYKKTGKKIQAINCYKQCARHYKANLSTKFYLNNLFDILKLQGKVKSMEVALKAYLKADDYTEQEICDKKEYFQNLLGEMYRDLLTIYAEQNRKEEMLNLINSIANDNLKQQMYKIFIVA